MGETTPTDARHRLTDVAYTSPATITDNSNQGSALFCYIKNATIQDLKVAGNIYTSSRNAAGLVACIYGKTNIRNKVVTTTSGMTTGASN